MRRHTEDLTRFACRQNMLFCAVNLGCNDAALPGSTVPIPVTLRQFAQDRLRFATAAKETFYHSHDPASSPPNDGARYNDPEPNRTSKAENMAMRSGSGGLQTITAVSWTSFFCCLGGEGDEDEYSNARWSSFVGS
jgi:hypothetical protein